MSQTSPDSATLKPCPLCQSTDIQPGVCYVDGSSTREDAARCGNCGCRATKRAWQSRGFAQTPQRQLYELSDEEYEAFTKALGAGKPPTQKLIDLMRDYRDNSLAPTPAVPTSLHDAVRGLNEALDDYWNTRRTDEGVKLICYWQFKCREALSSTSYADAVAKTLSPALYEVMTAVRTVFAGLHPDDDVRAILDPIVKKFGLADSSTDRRSCLDHPMRRCTPDNCCQTVTSPDRPDTRPNRNTE